MLATRIHQKESVFYFIAYKASDLMEKVRFTSRYYFEGEAIQAETPKDDDDVAKFIAGIERSEKGFQRALNKQKIRQIVNFYDTAMTQPMIPGTVLLFTDEILRFQRMGDSETIGHLSEPKGRYLIIDGQHRIAGLHFFLDRHPDQAGKLEVPCVLFDGRSADFATEMFVIINSTHTRINRSHLVDLYEKITWESPEKKYAAKVVSLLYSEDDSPLQYKINRLGGRSRKEKWILQSEVFNEVHKLVTQHARWVENHLGSHRASWKCPVCCLTAEVRILRRRCSSSLIQPTHASTDPISSICTKRSPGRVLRKNMRPRSSACSIRKTILPCSTKLTGSGGEAARRNGFYNPKSLTRCTNWSPSMPGGSRIIWDPVPSTAMLSCGITSKRPKKS